MFGYRWEVWEWTIYSSFDSILQILGPYIIIDFKMWPKRRDNAIKSDPTQTILVVWSNPVYPY